jgi:hypothetical protein
MGIIVSPNLMDLVVFQYLYGGFDAWPINTEFLRVSVGTTFVYVLSSDWWISGLTSEYSNQ